MKEDLTPKLTAEEELITRWIDGELPEGTEDVEGHLFSGPEAQKEIEAAREIGQLLRSGLESGAALPDAEGFTRSIMGQIS